MSKQVTYICDVCEATSTKPFKLHITANYGKESIFADVCCEKCALKFAETASAKAGILAHNLSDPIEVAS